MEAFVPYWFVVPPFPDSSWYVPVAEKLKHCMSAHVIEELVEV